MALLTVRRANVGWFAAGPLGLAYVLAALAVARGPGTYSTYAGRSSLAATLAAFAGVTLIGAGTAWAFGQPGRRIGALWLIAGFVWFAPDWVGWNDGPALIRSLGTLAAGFLLPVVIHLIVAYPAGRLRPVPARAFVAVVYAEAALSAMGRALFRDPSRAVNCWDNCTASVFLVRPLPGVVHAIEGIDLWFAAAAGTVLATLCAQRLVTATGPARRTLWPVLSGGAVLGAAVVAHSIAIAIAPEDPADPAFMSIFLALSVGVIVLAAGPLLAFFRARLQRRSVARIVADLGEAPELGTLQEALARVIGDPGLTIAYWLPSSSRYVDAHGRTVPEPAGEPGRSITTMVREGRALAAITHAAPVADLVRELGAAVRLALENERLQAEVLSQAEDIRASRARIVDAGDAARRRLERDLHDGAQQRLLALSYDLRLARAKAEADGDGDTAALLDDATDQTLHVLAELRELAHGIYPAILTEAGLGSALATLADSAPVAVHLVIETQERFPAPVETAAYVLAGEAIEDAGARTATRVDVSVERDDGRLVIRVEDDGAARGPAMIHVVDRVGALGGTVQIGQGMLRAEIPCG